MPLSSTVGILLFREAVFMAGEVLLGVGGIQFLCVCSLEVPGGRTAELHPLPLALWLSGLSYVGLL